MSCTQQCKGGNVFGKQTRKAINFNQPFLERWCQETLTSTSVIIENTAYCNTRFTALYYFFKCYLSKYKPIIYSEEKCSTILCKSTHVIGEYPSGEGLEFLRGTEQNLRYWKFYLVWQQLSEGKQSPSWHLSFSPSVIDFEFSHAKLKFYLKKSIMIINGEQSPK